MFSQPDGILVVMHSHSTDNRQKASNKVTLIGAAANVVLTTIQITLGIFGQSQALIADGLHTLSDLITDALVLLAVKHGAQEADDDHPYGHSRYETAATVILGVILIAVAGGIGYRAILRLLAMDTLTTPSSYTLLGAGAAILVKESLYQYTIRVARRLHSTILKANAWHHRSDAISSIFVLIGIAGSLAGWPWLDPAAALAVAMMIINIGWRLGQDAMKELVDTGLDPEEISSLKEIIYDVDGARSVHSLRTRRMGGKILIDVHLQVDGMISVSEGHLISETVRSRLLRANPGILDVLVHIDPENDEVFSPAVGLPLRGELLSQLQQAFSGIPEAKQLRRLTLHYLAGKIVIDLLLPMTVRDGTDTHRRLQQQFSQAVAGLHDIEAVHTHFE